METAFTRLFGLRQPIVQAPMGGVAGPSLVAAAANAGALGILPIWFLPPEQAPSLIAATRALTGEPFAVNVRADLVQLEHVSAALEAGVSTVHLFWGDPAASMAPIRAAGARMIATVWDADSAARAVDAGACALIAQGVEAGGHVRGTTPLAALLPIVREIAGDIPVAAAGGLVDGDDVARVLAHGADAAVLGTRLAASLESDAHDVYKRALIAAQGDATVLSTCFDGQWPDAPHRTLRNSTFTRWEAAGRPEPGARPGEGDVVLREQGLGEFHRYSVVPPTRESTGDCEAAALYAGMGVDRITDAPPVAEVIAAIVAALHEP
jgi:NAD(P)H-dependent flavin oxidoreductase YrpB (nitropropane dioxygenase family)